MTYNLTDIVSNSTSLVTLTQGVNTVLMGGFLGVMLLLSLFIVLISSFFFVTRDWPKSFAASTFICFIFAIFLRAMSLVPNLAVFITLIATAAAVAFIWKST